MQRKTGRIITGAVIFLINSLINAAEGSEIICSSQPVAAIIGQDVTLLCHLEPPVDATDMTVEWHHGYRDDTVHMYRGRKDNPAKQTERYEGRTSLFREGLTKGNLSLKLSSVQLTDSGRYRCFSRAKNIQQSCYVNLTVGEFDVIGSHEPVKVVVGHDVILPCHLEPPFNVMTRTVEWKCNEIIVHKYRSGKDYLADQDEHFKGRTSLFHDEMAKGNISLKLTSVTELDAGRYSCFVSKLESQVRRGYINLTVVTEPETDEHHRDSNNAGAAAGIGITITIVVIGAAFAVIVE